MFNTLPSFYKRVSSIKPVFSTLESEDLYIILKGLLKGSYKIRYKYRNYMIQVEFKLMHIQYCIKLKINVSSSTRLVSPKCYVISTKLFFFKENLFFFCS